MNLYFRLFWLLAWRSRRCGSIDFLGTSRISYRALPSDCDINFHLTNSRYPAFMDLARIYMLAGMGVLSRFIKLGWIPVVNAAEFTYILGIKPLAKFEIETKIVGWDEKYFYVEQRFVSDKGLHCIAHVRAVFVCKGKQVPIESMLEEAGFDQSTPDLSAEVLKWKDFFTAKKAEQ
ncbi:thioesterase family protein [Shewanella surugensis]|uniref:Thioesterase family protein n=1 Tax=Shewanella surugensis TaxID=212020 RepID=A0ABT0LDU9_9GAMM|nr:thioesterase family protein [Shewanella surugensis]MCL1125500.1 thioesterase family protein [Shewanella surugensis]